LPVAIHLDKLCRGHNLDGVILAPRARATILLVEDDFSRRRALDAFLTTEGFQVLCAANSGEGLGVLDSYELRPDLIVLDVADSTRFRSIQRQLPHSSGIPAIAIGVDVHAAAGLGFHRILEKPVDYVALLKAIGELLS
jgi:DNA-binding response OmpR family regulator